MNAAVTARPISTLLVANRGEIARRVMRTATAVGIRTVAVYADGDRAEPFVAEADLAVALGGRTAAATYLDIAKIVGACRTADADAVHPGYGFLSENAAFARAVLDTGLTWVGPSPDVIEAMGDKLNAKRVLADAGVPTLPSAEVGVDADLDAAVLTVGLPALVKAAAGGGGKGMRLVHTREGLEAEVAAARREAEAAFGDGTVFLERYLGGARHVEVQVLGDRHGNVWSLFERECSIQRRHQKIIEECPSPAVGAELRARMGDAAVAAARSLGYEGVGTVEFLLDGDGSFYFLEVNTRLQVEHPVTEMVTGLDLVHLQLLVAEGERLSVQPTMTGHAIEARVYAEDPAAGFLPANGTLRRWQPAAEPAVRWDSGVETGSVVGVEFDPLLAKAVAHGATRREASRRLALGLERLRVHGVVTNRDYLVGLLRHPRFVAGDTPTSFVDEVDVARRRVASRAEQRDSAIAVAVTRSAVGPAGAARFPPGWRNGVMPPTRVTLRVDGGEIVVEYHRQGENFRVSADGAESTVAVVNGGVAIDDRRVALTVVEHGGRWWVHGPAGEVVLDEVPLFPEPTREEVAGGLVAPMPGSVLAVHVAEGDTVAAGALLVVLEAMKMEHRITAPVAGTVREVRVVLGQQVGNGDLLVALDAGGSDG